MSEYDALKQQIVRLQCDMARLQAAQVRTQRARRVRLVLAAGLVLLGSALTAGAQQVTDKLVVFNGGTPALASEINGNFALLKAWIEDKIGAVGQPASISTTGSISAGSVSSTGNVNTAGATSSTAADTHGFAVTGSGDVSFFGQLSRADGGNNWDTAIVFGDDTEDRLRFVSDQCCGRGRRDAMTLDYLGNAHVAGDLNWDGQLKGFTVTSYSAEQHNTGGTAQAAMTSTANSICFLTRVQMEDIDSGGEWASCRIVNNSGTWELRAILNENNDADAWCAASCLAW